MAALVILMLSARQAAQASTALLPDAHDGIVEGPAARHLNHFPAVHELRDVRQDCAKQVWPENRRADIQPLPEMGEQRKAS